MDKSHLVLNEQEEKLLDACSNQGSRNCYPPFRILSIFSAFADARGTSADLRGVFAGVKGGRRTRCAHKLW